jgi:hypothetical protein
MVIKNLKQKVSSPNAFTFRGKIFFGLIVTTHVFPKNFFPNLAAK